MIMGFAFVDTAGNSIYMDSANIYFGVDKSGNAKWGRDYVEYIFDITNINLDKLKLMGNFVSHGNYVTGNWKTTFKIQSVGEELQTDCNIKSDTLNINNVKVSPLGVTLAGSGEINESITIPISVNMTDGSIQEFESECAIVTVERLNSNTCHLYHWILPRLNQLLSMELV